MPKKDLQQVRSVAVELGMSEEERQDFGLWLHELKMAGERGSLKKGDFTYSELRQRGREFLLQRRKESE